MLNFFRVPESIAKLLGTNRAHSPKVLSIFSVIYFSLEGLGAIAGPPDSAYDFPLTSIFWQIGVWCVVIPIGYLIHQKPNGKFLSLKNLITWFFASLFGLLLGANLIYLITKEPVPAEFPSSLLRMAATGFVNLTAYLIIISAVFEYREVAASLRRELTRLEVVRETIASHLDKLKARYLAEVQQKIAPVLADIQAALASANPDAVMGKARSAINDVILPLSANIAEGMFNQAMQELPEAPKRKLRLRLRQILNLKVDLQQASMPLIIVVVFVASLAPAYSYFYENEGMLAAAVTLAVILLGQLSVSLLVKKRTLSIFPAFALILVFSTALAFAAGSALQLIIKDSNQEANVFLSFGTWLLIFLTALLQAVNTLSSNYLSRLSVVQDEFARSLQKRDLEISQMQNRITSAIHNDIQGKLRAVLLRVRSGGLSSNNLVALETDLAHVRNALSNIDAKQELDFFSQLRALQDFWGGVCEIKTDNDLEAVELLESNNQLADRVFESISEGTANAVKHAEAELVEVYLSVQGAQLVLVLRNSIDKGLTSNPSSGIGSKVFDELSDGWKVRQSESGFELTVFFKIA